MRLASKVAIVTGAGAGIGRASALRFAAEGAHVVAADIDKASVQEMVSMSSTQASGSIRACQVDVASAASVEALITSTLEQHGRLDVLFSNAGIQLDGNAIDLPEEDWECSPSTSKALSSAPSMASLR